MFRSNIFDEINRLERDMDTLCSSGQCVALVSSKKRLQEISRLPVSNVYETENAVIATFELPGVEKEAIQLNVTEDSIEVKVEKKAEKKVEEKDSYAYEMRSHSFYSLIPLPAEVVAENSDASYSNGILRVEIPKAKKQDTRKRIEVK